MGVFDSVSALRVAMELLGVRVIGHVSIEKQAEARRLVASHFHDVVH